jgi:hypothetical protein
MAEYRVHFIESSPEDNPIKFEIMPLPNQDFLRVLYDVIEKNPHNEFGTAEVTFDGVGFKIVVWDRTHTLGDDEDDIMKLANSVYNLKEYSPHRWRNILEANDVDNSYTFKQEFAGKLIKIPAIIPPEIIQGFVQDWITKTNVELSSQGN